MRVPLERLAPLALVAAVTLAAVAVAQDTVERVPEPKTNCVECHDADSPPLKAITSVTIPPQEITETAAPYKFAIKMPWQPRKPAYLNVIDARLDLTNATSLSFAVPPTPPPEEESGGVDAMPPPPPVSGTPELQTRFHEDKVVYVVPGATMLRLAVQPTDTDTTTGADIKVEVYPGSANATGDPIVLDEGGRGAGELTSFEGQATFDLHGYGNWTVRTIVDLSAEGSADGRPTVPGRYGYVLRYELDFKGSGGSVVRQVTRDPLESGKTRIFTFQLQKVGEPSPDQRVHLVLNTTPFHEHESTNPNYDNATRTYSYIPEVGPSGGIILTPAPETGNGIVRPSAATLSLTRLGEVVGYVGAVLIVSSIVSGGMFGKASRRGLNRLFGSARRRVAFHNVLSYGIIAFSIIHTVMFLVEAYFHWTVGLIWGGIAILIMFALGVTGAFQIPLIRSWGYSGWRWTHYGLSVAVIVFTVVHMLLDGQNFADIQKLVGWKDPLDPRDFN